MQKKILQLLVIFMVIPFIMKAEWIPLNKQSNSSAPPSVTLVSDDNSSTVIKIEISGFELKDFISGDKQYQQIDLLSESFTNYPGYPELPYIAKVLAIPDHAGVSVEVLESGEIQTFNNIYLIPARESWIEGSPETPYSEDTDAYNSMIGFPGEFVQIDQPSVFRDFRIARVSVYPIRYIPAKKELQVVSYITVRINYGPGEVINPKTSTPKPIAPSFGQLYKSLIFNYESVLNNLYGGKNEAPELMLCIMPDEFVTSFQTYATWKRQSGIDIHVTKFSDIGATSSDPTIIKNHIADAYHNWLVPPTYVLLVGDDGVLPTTTANGYVSENYYVEIDGNDYFPELLLGRFTNTSDYGMQVMINKFIKYEKTPYTTSTAWFKKGICCSNDAYPSQIQTKREAATYMRVDGGFTSVDTMSDPGCTYSNADVVAAINEGRSFLNYRGEGWTTGWWATCTPMTNTEVNGLANGEKFTFVTSIGCGVAMFASGESFGETWMELGTLSVPRGAAAFLGPAGNTHTAYNNNIDRGIYKGMFQEGLETPGQALLRGKLYMYNVFGGGDSYVSYHYKIYCALGDPSIHIWKDVPKAISVNYPAFIPLGSNLVEFTVTHTATGLPVANAQVCVTGTSIFATGHTDATGKAYIDIFSEEQEILNVTVRGGNVIPFTGTMELIPPTGPYVIRDSYTLNDNAGGNNNGLMDYGESILLSLTMINVGSQTASNVNVSLSTSNPYITFTDNIQNFGNIAAGQVATGTNAFAFNVASNLPDLQDLVVNVAAVSGITTWNSNFTITGHAPDLIMGNITINDPLGNNNGRLDPGETATITAVVNNNGHSVSPYATAVLTSPSPYITINSGTSNLGQIAAGSSANAVFTVTCSSSTPIGTNVDLVINVSAGSYGFIHTHPTPVGLVLEDWELGNFTRFPWIFSGNANWAVVNAGQYEGSFTAISGAIEDNQTSSISVMLQVNAAGSVSFYRKISTESNYDYLRFYIDGVQQGQWAGTIDWGQISYPITTGVHTFKWAYEKDYSVSSGSDCVWVDYIIFPASTIIAPEISVNPSFFTKSVFPAGTANDVLNIANTGNLPLNFDASVEYIDNSDVVVTVYPQAINYWSGSCTSTTKTQVSAIKAVSPSEVGWIKFDISSIPPGSTINSVEFHGYIYDNLIPHWSITPVSVDPVTAGASVLYGDINAEANSGYYLFRNETTSYPDGWIAYMLSGSVNTNLAAALNQGWFAIGVVERHTSTNNIKFNGCNSSNKPYLVIDYTVPPVPTWLKINGGNTVTGSVAAGNNQNITLTFDAGSNPEGTYQANIIISNNDPDEAQLVIPCTMIISAGMNVSVKAYLEGAFNGTSMSSSINSVLPLVQPYNTAPWNYSGTESVTTMPANVADWVLVELRDATTAANATLATRIARQAALLLTNGSIVAIDGTSPLFFSTTFSNNLFVVVWHRNHLAVLSANPVPLTGENYTYDFSTSSAKAYGANAQKELTDGYFGMWCGDMNGDGTINAADLVPAWKSNSGKTGYYPADLNFNRQVNNPDKDTSWQPNSGKGTNVPQ
jgi:hypothetical protein